MHLESEPVPTIGIATSDAQIMDCFPVMSQLRPHLVETEFLARIQRQIQSAGYVLAFLKHGPAVQSVAGFRISECLYSGRYLYIDDLATNVSVRSKGYGG